METVNSAGLVVRLKQYYW